METIILASLIFWGVGSVIYQYGIKKRGVCDCSSVDCPIKNNKKQAR